MQHGYLEKIYPMKLVYLLFLCFLITALNGQCDPDRHNTSGASGWVSCQATPNPNPARSTGHWIMYDSVSYTHLTLPTICSV